MGRIFFLLSLVVSGLFAASCAPSFHVVTPKKSTGFETYDFGKAYRENSCLIPFERGGPAPLALPPRRIESRFFGKKFDRSRLEAIGFASPKALAEFMVADGVTAYSMPLVLPGACAALGSLTTAPENLQEYWNEIAGGGVLGVYLPLSRSKPLGEDKPLILLRADTDRYTLAHEYLHHVFNEVRELHGDRNEDLMSRLETRGLRYEEVGPLASDRESDGVIVEKYLGAWTEYQEVFLEALVVFPLEEVAIEALLQEAAARNEFGPVTMYNRVNSAAYLSRSFEQGALESLRRIRSRAENNRTLAHRHGLSHWEKASEDLARQADLLMKEGEALTEKYARLAKTLPISKTGTLHPHAAGTECAHQRLFQEKIKPRGL